MLQFIAFRIFVTLESRRNFNTSHVVVYHALNGMRLISIFPFQYISCCSLSHMTHTKWVDSTIFQYISCCSLSANGATERMAKTNFNTSHVVVYLTLFTLSVLLPSFQYISCCSLSQNIFLFLMVFPYFNTSHVVVYLLPNY